MSQLSQWKKRILILLKQPHAKRIMLLVVAIWIFTIIGFWFELYSSQYKLVATLFQSWLGDVIFFTAVGALLAIISSVPPALEPYEERANILFQGQNGSQVEHAKLELSKLGNYSEYLRILISIHDDEGDWFKLTTTSSLKIKNLIEDVVTTYRLPVSDPEQLANPPGKIGRVVTFLVDGKQIFSEQAGGISPPVENYLVEIGGERAPEILITAQSWIGRNGYVAHTPARFTKSFSLSIINRSQRPVFLKNDILRGELLELEACQPSASALITEMKDIKPFIQAYEFRLFKTREAVMGYIKKKDSHRDSAVAKLGFADGPPGRLPNSGKPD